MVRTPANKTMHSLGRIHLPSHSQRHKYTHSHFFVEWMLNQVSLLNSPLSFSQLHRIRNIQAGLHTHLQILPQLRLVNELPPMSGRWSNLQRTLLMMARVLENRIPVYFTFCSLMGVEHCEQGYKNWSTRKRGKLWTRKGRKYRRMVKAT